MNSRNRLAIGIIILLVIVAGIFGFHAAFDKSEGTGNHVQVLINRAIGTPSDFSKLADLVERSLVNISTEREDTGVLRNPLRNFFKRRGSFDVYGDTREDEARENSLGSGFIVSSDGYILTNSHVVENASRISVKLSDKRTLVAVLVGTDPKTDLAVLKIREHNLPALHLSPSDGVAVGEWVAAFGSPSDLEQTMTAGIISAKGRVIGSDLYDNFLQTDAAINAGNSGGPLMNLRGEVIGINTTVANRNLGFNGIGFAIPAATALHVYEQLIRSGKVTRGWIGVQIQEVTPQIARSFDLNNPQGALVADIAPNGPAAKAGLKSGDIILEFNHQPIQTAHDLLSAVANARVGSLARIRTARNGKEIPFDVTVGERPSAVAEFFRSPEGNAPGELGIMVENVTPDVQAQMHLASDKGVLVIEVIPGSSAESGGVLPGDVIHSINREPVNKAADLLAAMRNLKENGTVMLGLERRGRLLYLAFQLSS